jgi:hypothetical protein
VRSVDARVERRSLRDFATPRALERLGRTVQDADTGDSSRRISCSPRSGVSTSRARRRNALGALHWDMATMMPAGGAEARAEQLADEESEHRGRDGVWVPVF